jgi:hypothetical protein
MIVLLGDSVSNASGNLVSTEQSQPVRCRLARTKNLARPLVLWLEALNDPHGGGSANVSVRLSKIKPSEPHMVSADLGIKLENVTINMLGRAKKVTVEKDNTTIVSGAGKKNDIQGRIVQIKAQIEETTSDYDREKLQERLAKLAGGVAVIRVGGATEVEVKERKDRVDDTMHATRAAVEEGILPGGGVALLRAGKVLDKLKGENDDQRPRHRDG